mmetsp:Transcript_9224/g.10625  ORF Transcript_9224/g.10625 Transcript_9224/m.10625 type:complete len:1245 (-) Transcript_9224:145-3879(-)
MAQRGGGLKQIRNRQTQSNKKEKTFFEEAQEEAEKEDAEPKVTLVHFDDVFSPPKPKKKKKHNDQRQTSHFNIDAGSELSSNSGFETEYSETTVEDVFGPLKERDFEVANPSLPAQEVVYDILSKGGNTMTVARKLFLLEQLKNNAPSANVPKPQDRPENGGPPPKLLQPAIKRRASRNRPLSFRLTGLGMHLGETKPKRSKAQKRADETLTGPAAELPSKQLIAKAKQVGATGCWKLSEFCRIDGEIDDFQMGLYLKIQLLRDSCRIIRNLHNNDTTHGGVSADNVYINRNLEVALLAVDTIEQDDNELKKQYDVLGFGVTVLEFMTKLKINSENFPKLSEAIEREKKSGFTYEGADEIYEEVENSIEPVEKEVKDSLKGVICPPSLLELCVQSCSPERFKRPMAEDAYEWIDSLLDEVVKDKFKDSKVNALVALLSSKESLDNVITGPSLINQKGLRAEDMVDDDEEEDADELNDDDSYMPPEDEESGAPKKPNQLSQFLDATSDQNQPVIPTTKSVNGLGDDVEGVDAHDGARSLDRGYEHAKNKLQQDFYHSDIVNNSTFDLVQETFTEVDQIRKNFATESIDPEKLARQFEIQDRLPVEQAVALVQEADSMLQQEPNLLKLEGPVNVVGDIHGQFFDLRSMFRIGGPPGEVIGKDENGKELKRTYLFLGDYVDRGAFSCEVILYLFALKLKYPEHIYLLRGNHESRIVASYFGFKEECSMKYGVRLFNACAQAFQSLPIAATVDTYGGKWLCLHGGISPNVTSLHQFVEFDRFAEPSMTGFLCDILWSDPISDSFEDGAGQSLGEFLSIDFLPNPVRGCSYRYGYRALIQFLAINGLVGIIRAHEVQEEGFRYHFQEISGGKKGDATAQVTPPVITVFSAPNYCGRYGNKAAFMRISKDLESHQAGARNSGGAKPKKKKKKRKTRIKFGRKKKVEHSIHRAIRPLQLVEPIQFQAVYSPEPLQFENEDRKQQLNIEMVCPYMPTTFSAFIRKALELEALETEEEKHLRGSVVEVKKKRNSISHPDFSLTGQAATPPPVPNRPKNWKAIKMLGLDENENEEEEAEPVKEKTAEEIQKSKEYKEAASADSIYELNPIIIAEKVQKAQKMDLDNVDLPSTVRIESEEAKQARRKSLNSNKVSFTKNEITALQALFLLIDRRNTGKLEVDDLITWSRESGQFTSEEDTAACMDYVDIDRDGFIGFGDYLAFAAKNKELWLKSQFTKVLGQVKMLRERNNTLGR